LPAKPPLDAQRQIGGHIITGSIVLGLFIAQRYAKGTKDIGIVTSEKEGRFAPNTQRKKSRVALRYRRA